jgi:hypothetical protein
MTFRYKNTINLFNMPTLPSCPTIEGLGFSIAEEILLMRTSRTATFTLSSSSSSSSYSNLYNHQNGQTSTKKPTSMYSSSSNSYYSKPESLRHSQKVTLDNQRRRPTIHDPYQIVPNLEILNDWLIVSFFFWIFICIIRFLTINLSPKTGNSNDDNI